MILTHLVSELQKGPSLVHQKIESLVQASIPANQKGLEVPAQLEKDMEVRW